MIYWPHMTYLQGLCSLIEPVLSVNAIWKIVINFPRKYKVNNYAHTFHLIFSNMDYRHQERVFFPNFKLLGLGRHIKLKCFGHMGYFWLVYQHPCWYCVHVFHELTIISTKSYAFISTSQTVILGWDLNLCYKKWCI